MYQAGHHWINTAAANTHHIFLSSLYIYIYILQFFFFAWVFDPILQTNDQEFTGNSNTTQPTLLF
jgi:hypothetical protein